jgi:curved DNA-binding protein
MEYKDYYKTLGVERSAGADEIKRAYRKLARKFHPDVSRERDAEEQFKSVQEAYEVLKDPEKRSAYDQLGANWRSGQEFRPPPGWNREFHFHTSTGPGAAGFSDFFEQFFGGARGFDSGGRTGRRTRSAPAEEEHTLEISLEESYQGGTRTLQLQGPEVGAFGRARVRNRTLNVRIPSGIGDGQRIRLAGQGSPSGASGRAGDLFLKIKILPHRLYQLEGKDVTLDLPVAPWEAALGAKIEAPTPGGRVTLNVPAGSKGGNRLRLKGRGLPGKPPGDFYVTLRIVNPPHDSPKARALFEQMARDLPFDPRAGLGS